MIIDLARQPEDISITAAIVVIGGGIAGLLLANRLRDRRLPVVVLESGGQSQGEQPHPLNEVVQLSAVYRGALDGRARGLGGTSTMWGGALIPFLPQDMQARPHAGIAAWPVGLDAVAPYIGELERLFGVDRGAYDEQFVDAGRTKLPVPIGDADFMARFAKWPVFKHRNVANLLRTRLQNDQDLRVYVNATVTAFATDAAADRITGVEARHVGGRTVKVTADRFVICAGAIESTRLLLLLDRQTDQRAFAGTNALGRYFHDHVSAQAAIIATPRPLALNRMAAFRFVGSTMRSLRFEMTPATQAADRVGSAFGHIAFQAPDGEFSALRDMLRSLQRTGRPDFAAALRLARDVPYLARLGLWRYAHKQLLWPTPARYELHIVGEQFPRHENRIVLDARTDMLGSPRAAIDWRIDTQDLATIRAYARRFEGFWQRHFSDLENSPGNPAWSAMRPPASRL